MLAGSSGVPVVTDGSVFLSSVGVLGKAVMSGSDSEVVELQFFCSLQKASSVFVESQEDMNYDGTLVKTPPASRRKIMRPTPRQSPQPSIEVTQL